MKLRETFVSFVIPAFELGSFVVKRFSHFAAKKKATEIFGRFEEAFGRGMSGKAMHEGISLSETHREMSKLMEVFQSLGYGLF